MTSMGGTFQIVLALFSYMKQNQPFIYTNGPIFMAEIIKINTQSLSFKKSKIIAISTPAMKKVINKKCFQNGNVDVMHYYYDYQFGYHENL